MPNIECIETQGVISSESGAFDPVYFRKAGLIAFICSRCDMTHLALICEGIAFSVSLSMSPAAAEALAAELVNPRPDPFTGRRHD